MKLIQLTEQEKKLLSDVWNASQSAETTVRDFLDVKQIDSEGSGNSRLS